MAADREQIPAEQTCEKGNKLDKSDAVWQEIAGNIRKQVNA